MWGIAAKAVHRRTINISRTFSLSSTNQSHTNDNEPSSSSSSLNLYNSLSQRIETVPTLENGGRRQRGLAWYTCGPTVYDAAHLGHARTYVCLDILRRVLEWNHQSNNNNTLHPPLFVLNITDVDDKILAAAARNKNQLSSPLDLARYWEAEFWRDWDDLHCLRPHVVTRVTEHVVSSIVPYIQTIWDKGFAYSVDKSGVYFDVKAFQDAHHTYGSKFGKLAPLQQATDLFDSSSRIGLSQQQQSPAEEQEDASTIQKRDPRDFCLWKLQKPGESMVWPSPWGDGRPGWHIECSAMIEAIQEQFGDQYKFMVHAGGIDLKFPHHTNEIAQAEAYHFSKSRIRESVPQWIPQWLHTGHLHIDGLKMSKSLKNFITIREMLEDDEEQSGAQGAWASPSDDFRLWCLGLSGSYRGPAVYSMRSMAEARQIRCEKLCRFLELGERVMLQQEEKSRNGSSTKTWSSADMDLFQASLAARSKCVHSLHSDLDGTTFVKELVQLAEMGLTYVRTPDESGREDSRPSEVLRNALQITREMLALVGFSSITFQAGIQGRQLSDSNGDDNDSTGVAGGERALLDKMVVFRQNIRNCALSSSKDETALALKKDILRLCDEARTVTFPLLGIELYDPKTGEGSTATADQPSWTYCVPRKAEVLDKSAPSSSTNLRLEDVPLEKLFCTGIYEGKFSAYTEDGFPTHDANGKELSKNQQKKLRKKRQAHERRLSQQLSTEPQRK